MKELEVLLKYQDMNWKEKYNNAIHYAKTLLSLAQKTEASYYILNAYKVLWEIYDKKKDSAIAYKYYLKYTECKRFNNKRYIPAEVSSNK